MWHLVAEAFQPATAAFILAVVILKLLEWRRGALRDERKRMERIIAPIVEGAFDNSVRKFLELDRNRWMSQSDDVRSGLGSYLQCLQEAVDCSPRRKVLQSVLGKRRYDEARTLVERANGGILDKQLGEAMFNCHLNEFDKVNFVLKLTKPTRLFG